MASPFMWAAAMTFESANLGLGNHRGVGWAIGWTVLAAIFAAKLMDSTLGCFDRRLGRMETVETRLGRSSRSVRVVCAVYSGCALLLCLLALDRSLAPIAASLQFTLGSLVVAGTAALSPFKMIDKDGPWTAIITEISPGRIVFLRWMSAIRRMWLALLIPLVVVALAVGPENVALGRAAGAGGLHAECVRFRGESRNCGRGLVAAKRPGGAARDRDLVAHQREWICHSDGRGRGSIAQGVSMYSPFAGVWSLATAIGRGVDDFAGAFGGLVWSIGFSLFAALILFASMARSSGMIGAIPPGRRHLSADEAAAAERPWASAVGGLAGERKDVRCHTLDWCIRCQGQSAHKSCRDLSRLRFGSRELRFFERLIAMRTTIFSATSIAVGGGLLVVAVATAMQGNAAVTQTQPGAQAEAAAPASRARAETGLDSRGKGGPGRDDGFREGL